MGNCQTPDDMACSGHLECGETLEEAVIREAKEEIGIDVLSDDLELVTVVHPKEEGYLRFFFKANKYSGVPRIMEKNKCSDLNWFDIDDLPVDTIKAIKSVLVNIRNGINYDDGDFSHQKRLVKR